MVLKLVLQGQPDAARNVARAHEQHAVAQAVRVEHDNLYELNDLVVPAALCVDRTYGEVQVDYVCPAVLVDSADSGAGVVHDARDPGLHLVGRIRWANLHLLDGEALAKASAGPNKLVKAVIRRRTGQDRQAKED